LHLYQLERGDNQFVIIAHIDQLFVGRGSGFGNLFGRVLDRFLDVAF
jgi:hypothetical protein